MEILLVGSGRSGPVHHISSRNSLQGKKLFFDKVVTRFRLSERIPPHNRYRRFAGLVDWTFLYEETRGLYSHTGQPSLDPAVFSKHVLVGRLENLVSDGFFVTTGRKTTSSHIIVCQHVL